MARLVIATLAMLAAAGGAAAGCHPMGTAVADQIETAAFAAGFTLVCSRASRGLWLAVGALAVLLSRGLVLIPAGITMVGVFGAVFVPRTRRRIGAAIGALGVQAMLRWSPALFHGFPSLVAALLTGAVAFSAWSRSSRRTRRLAVSVVGSLAGLAVLLSLPALIETLVARGSASAAESEVRSALTSIGSGRSTTITSELESATSDASAASGSLNEWYTKGALLVPFIAEQERFLADSTRAAATAARVAASQSPAVDYHRLDYHDGQIDLSKLSAMERPMTVLSAALAVAHRSLVAADSSWLVGPLNNRAASFRREVGGALHAARLATQAAKLLPGMLGGDGTRTYLVAFMTPAESRGYDGLIASYGLLTANSGRVRLAVSGSINDIQIALPSGGAHLSGPADFLSRYGKFHPGQFPQDASYSPDLPTVAGVLNQIFRQAGEPPIDGVLALDPYGLAALLHFTGPVQVSGLPFPLTEQNAVSVLLRQQYTTFDVGESGADLLRHDFLQGALHSAFEKLVAGSLPAPKELAAVLDPAVMAGRISFWSFHKDEQPFLRNLGIGGAFPSAGSGDLLAVTTQDSGNNKIDAYLHTSVDDQVTFDPSNGATQSTVTVHLRNDAPASGLPPIVIDSPADPGLPPGTNRLWLTIYSPLALERIDVNGRSGTANSGHELGVRAYSLYVDVPSRGAVTVQAFMSGVLAARSAFAVVARLQPAANTQSVTVDVAPVGPWHLTTESGDSGEWTLSGAMLQRRVFRFGGT